jgi:multidrug efflux pump subunit AcrA (membrane-fusion protein)
VSPDRLAECCLENIRALATPSGQVRGGGEANDIGVWPASQDTAPSRAPLAQAKAQLSQAQVNFERTQRIHSPIDGCVTSLLAQLGDYVNVSVNTISLVDATSFWVAGYFEETNLAPIRVDNQLKSSS